jgi:glycosyltransferase involved in cell wall biosynthesis
MKILNVAYPFAPVSRDAVGGAEQVLNHIVEAVVCAGHNSITVARNDSQVPGKLAPIPIADGPLNHHDARAMVYECVRQTIHSTIETESPDLLHFHGIDFYEYLSFETKIPILVTLHLPPEWYPQACFDGWDNVHFNCVSEDQSRRVPGEIKIVPNGVPIPVFAVRPKKRDYIMCLGRICPEKGFHFALDAAAKLNLPLVLAGEVFKYDAHQSYFKSEILPRLSERRRFIGPIGRARKHRLLAAARCIVIPSTVNETSSLVAMEALACATPVVAFRNGALPSIIDHGRTGILVNNPAELPEAIEAARSIDPAECRHVAIEKFSCDAMTRRYLALYEELSDAAATRQTDQSWCAAIDAQNVS